MTVAYQEIEKWAPLWGQTERGRCGRKLSTLDSDRYTVKPHPADTHALFGYSMGRWKFSEGLRPSDWLRYLQKFSLIWDY